MKRSKQRRSCFGKNRLSSAIVRPTALLRFGLHFTASRPCRGDYVCFGRRPVRHLHFTGPLRPLGVEIALAIIADIRTNIITTFPPTNPPLKFSFYLTSTKIWVYSKKGPSVTVMDFDFKWLNIVVISVLQKRNNSLINFIIWIFEADVIQEFILIRIFIVVYLRFFVFFCIAVIVFIVLSDYSNVT